MTSPHSSAPRSASARQLRRSGTIRPDAANAPADATTSLPTPSATQAGRAPESTSPPRATHAPSDPLPRFLRTRERTPTPPWLAVACGVLLITLATQSLLADRASLSQSPRWRSLLETLTAPLGLALPGWQEPEAFRMVERSIVPVPGQPGVLQVTAHFRNTARWTQTLPLIELTLSSADGVVSGQRQFTPDQYQPAGDSRLMQPGEQRVVTWQIHEPALPADAFHFRFR